MRVWVLDYYGYNLLLTCTSSSDECTLDGTDVPFSSCSAECLMGGLLELYMFYTLNRINLESMRLTA